MFNKLIKNRAKRVVIYKENKVFSLFSEIILKFLNDPFYIAVLENAPVQNRGENKKRVLRK
jgi:hypothetical protein